LFRSGQHSLTTVIFSNGQTDFSKKTGKVFPDGGGGGGGQVKSDRILLLRLPDPALDVTCHLSHASRFGFILR